MTTLFQKKTTTTHEQILMITVIIIRITLFCNVNRRQIHKTQQETISLNYGFYISNLGFYILVTVNCNCNVNTGIKSKEPYFPAILNYASVDINSQKRPI